MFGFYLAYELIDSTFLGRARQVDKESIDAFLEFFKFRWIENYSYLAFYPTP